MNPIWAQMIHKAIKEAIKKCPHCGKSAAYLQKRAGQFYKCNHCGRRFKERRG